MENEIAELEIFLDNVSRSHASAGLLVQIDITKYAHMAQYIGRLKTDIETELQRLKENAR
jgi:hypothetical protein